MNTLTHATPSMIDALQSSISIWISERIGIGFGKDLFIDLQEHYLFSEYADEQLDAVDVEIKIAELRTAFTDENIAVLDAWLKLVQSAPNAIPVSEWQSLALTMHAHGVGENND